MSQLTTLRGKQPPIPWVRPDRAPKEASTESVFIGPDPNGLGFEVAVASWMGQGAPTQEALRSLHSARLRSRAIPLCIAVHRSDGKAWILGPNAAVQPLEVAAAQAARLLQAALDEPSAGAARTRMLQARDALETAELPGFDSQGLFAIHDLTVGVPRRPDWQEASKRGRALMDRKVRGLDLVRGLGFGSHSIPGNAQLLTVGHGPPVAVAILLRDDEAFDAESARFARSAIYHGLDLARRNNVQWLMLARGSQLRLYPTAPHVGVGRRGVTQTYFGLDLALLDDEHAGYLDLIFSARALREGGTVDDLLRSSADYAVDLGDRLRERIYERVVDRLSVAVATSLAAEGPLDDARLALAYRLTLRVLFRLLFQAYAEDTRLLPLHRNERYTRESLKVLAHDLAEHPDLSRDPNSTSWWDGLERVWRVIDRGDQAWGVPAYNGGLFGDDPQLQPDGALIAGLKLRNDVMGDVLTGLLVDETKEGTRGPVDFRSLDVRAFGTIYEGLLEAGLSVADVDLAVDATGSWRPAKEGEAVLTRAGQAYFHTQSGSRKATGSYFTKPFAVEHLLDRALDPTLDEHLARVGALLDAGDQAGAAHQFFDFRVADLAMGSGHFLVAAIGHIEAKFGAFLETHPIPGVERELLDLRQAAGDALSRVGVEAEIDRSALLGRQIARRCIYGLDINDIAVELARLAIWVRTFVPGLPMSSLDHQLVCGDSLTGIGQVEEAVEALDPGAASSANLSFTGQAISTALRAAKVLLEDAAELKEASTEETRAAQQAAQAALRAAEPARLLFDAALAVRLGLQPVPADFDPVAIGRSAAGPAVQTALARLAPIHFPVRFPEVFLRPGEGFDVLIGNPPWEKLHVKEDVWWSLRFPGVMSLPVAERDARIVSIAASRPDLVSALEAEKQHDEAQKRAISSAPFPGLGAAHIDLFAAFAWRNWQLTRSGGRIGVVLPRTAFGGSSLSEWRLAVLRGGAMDDICFLTNTGRWVFAEVHPQYTVALSVIRRAPVGVVRFSGPFHSDREFHSRQDQPFSVPVDAFVTWSGTYAFPFLPTPESGAIFLQMRRHPRFDSEDGFAFRPVQGDLNITTQRDIFVVGPQPRGSDIPVVAGATFGLWNPDHGAPYGWAGDDAIRWLLARAKKGTSSARSPYLGMEVRFVDDLAMSRARIVLRQIARPTDARTTITCLQPPRRIMASGAHYLHRRRGTAADEALVLAIMASVPFDWYARRWVELNFTFELLNPMPVPRPSVGNPMRERLVALGGRLAAVDDRFRLWANEVGVPVGGLLGGARDDAIAEIDALVAHLYGLSRSQLQHVFETFHRGWDYSDRLARVLAHYDRWASAS